MTEREFSPQESFALINNMIAEARNRFVESGHIYVFWGAFIFTLAFAQYLMIHNGYAYISYYPYFLIPFGVFYSFYYYRKKGEQTSHRNQISKLLTHLWTIVSINMTILGFFFFGILKANLIPVLLLFSGIGVSISGIALKERIVIFAGIFSNILGLAAFWFDLATQPLIMAIAALFSLLLPGLWLRKTHKARNEV